MSMIAASLNDLKQKAEQGDTAAMFDYAMCLKNGVDCDQDIPEAIKYLEKVSEKGVSDASLELGICYSCGIGVFCDEKNATEWYRRSAELGNAEAMYRLFQNLSIGAGCGTNLTEADRWLRNAADQGHEKAQETLRLLTSSRTLDDDLRTDSYEQLEKEADNLGIETIIPDKYKGYFQLPDPQENIKIPPMHYEEIIAPAVISRLYLVYIIAGALSGFLLMSVFNKGISVYDSYKVANAFSSQTGRTIFMVIVGTLVGLLFAMIMSALISKMKEKLFAYFPVLLLPLAVITVAPLIVTLFGGIKTLFAGILTIIGYIIAGFCILGSSSGN